MVQVIIRSCAACDKQWLAPFGFLSMELCIHCKAPMDDTEEMKRILMASGYRYDPPDGWAKQAT